MRILFFGTPAFAVPSLAALRDAGHEVAAVITQPDRAQGRSRSTLVAPPVKQDALAHHHIVWQPERPRGEPFLSQMRALEADLGVVVAYGHLLPQELLAIPRHGMVNVHASILPRWRGAAPIQWSILAGDTETGISIMRVEAGLDTGAVWQVAKTAISEEDTAGTLTDRLATLGAEALLAALPRIASGDAPTPQDDRLATHAPKIDRGVARIRWNESACEVACRIRAMDPAPGAYTTIRGTEIKLFGATMCDGDGAHGEILDVTDGLAVATGAGAVRCTEVQPAGKRRMPAADWAHGGRIAPGTILG